MAPSSSHHATKIKHDVFISFRGADVRRGLLSHLIKEFRRAHVNAYVDDRLEIVDEISSSLLKAIGESQILLVIFSKDYASSKWCLEELEEMVDCMERNEQILISVFYNVDPSEVRHQTGDYGAALAKHEKYFKEDMAKVQNWRSALKKAAQLSGLHYPLNFENESDLVDEIVKDVSNKLSRNCNSESNDPTKSNAFVGIDQNIAWIRSLLTTESREVLKLGIWGMGGIGKTTIARIVFDTFSPQYQGCCFLENIRGELERHQLSYLQEKLVSKLLEEESLYINGIGKANYSTKRMLRKKVLVVLDDVNTPKLLKDFLEPICFGARSKVIVTSRDKQVFIAGGFHEIHEIKELNFEESLELFCMHAFNESQPKMGYEELSKKTVAIAKGNPLALIVFGSYFNSKIKDTWECALEKFKKYPNEDIQRVLRLSYDGLDDLEKKVFLDIAFFFKEEDKDYVIRLLDAWHFHGACGIEALQQKALISISKDNRVQMHDLIQEMGWEIVRQESPDPGKRSRLRDAEEVYDVLENNKGTNLLEGMLLDVSQIGEVALNIDNLKRMPNMRLLKFYYPVEVPMQIRYFVPEDFVNVILKIIQADDMIEEMVRIIIHEESNGWDIDDVLKISKGTPIVDAMQILDKMNILRLMKLNLLSLIKSNVPMHVEYPMLSLLIMQDFVNAKGSVLDTPEQFVKLQKWSKLQGVYKLLNYNECEGVLILETTNVSGCSQLMPLPNLNIGSALKELMSLGGEVHIKSLHYHFMDGCSVSKKFSALQKEIRLPNSSIGLVNNLECLDSDTEGLQHENFGPKESSVLPKEIRQLNLRDTRMELLNSSLGHFSSLECLDIEGLQHETLPKGLPFLRSTCYHRLSKCRKQDIRKPELRIVFDGLRHAERISFLCPGQLSCQSSYVAELKDRYWIFNIQYLSLPKIFAS